MTKIPKDKLHLMIGKHIHINGWDKRATYELTGIVGDRIFFCTPKTRTPYTHSADRALYTRKYETQEKE